MSTFTRRDVQQLAGLARLDLTDDETALFARQLGDILTFVRQVQTVDTSALDEGDPPDEGDAAPLREDVVRHSLNREEALAASPDADAATGLFTVPRVLNG